MAKNYSNIIVYDLETGGLKAGVHGVCEVAMILIDIVTLEEIDRYEAIIQPYKNLNGEDMLYEDSAFKVNGLSMKKIMNGKPSDQVVDEICNFMKGAKSKSIKPILAGHNIDKFDNIHLADFFGQHKKDIMKFVVDDSIDTIKWAKMKWMGEEGDLKFNLGACCKRVGVRLIDAHSAMPDTEANAKLLVHMLTSLRGSGVNVEEDRTTFRENFTFEY